MIFWYACEFSNDPYILGHVGTRYLHVATLLEGFKRENGTIRWPSIIVFSRVRWLAPVCVRQRQQWTA